MYTRIRTLLMSAGILVALAACGGSPPAETAPAQTAPPVLTDIPLENQTAYPAPPATVPEATTAYPGQAPAASDALPPAYPGATVTP